MGLFPQGWDKQSGSFARMQSVQPYWYALTTRPNLEPVSSSALERKGFETFLPTYRARREWSDRIKELWRPLFPGYIFCRFEAQRRLPILTTPGIVSIVGFGKEPTPVDETELASVRALVRSCLPISPWPFLREGQRVRIVRGSLDGVEGIFLRHKQDCRLVVSIALLQRSVSAEIDSDSIRPL